VHCHGGQMMPTPNGRQRLSERELQVLRAAHGEWASRFIIYSLVACFAILDYTRADDRARIPALILLATMILINVVWRRRPR
jgi:hypothetical protein